MKGLKYRISNNEDSHIILCESISKPIKRVPRAYHIQIYYTHIYMTNNKQWGA